MRRAATGVAATLGALAVTASVNMPMAGAAIGDTAAFYTPRPDHGAIEQIAQLTDAGRKDLANDVRTMIETPQAVWVTGGSGQQLTQSVKAEAQRAAGKNATPVFVAYNLPFRDCSQYSAGGAASVADYEAW